MNHIAGAHAVRERDLDRVRAVEVLRVYDRLNRDAGEAPAVVLVIGRAEIALPERPVHKVVAEGRSVGSQPEEFDG